MPRVSVTIPDETYKKIEDRAKIKGEQTISQCANELIELGLRVEEATEKNRENNNEELTLIDELRSIKMMLEHNMTWTVESRAYARFFMETMSNQPPEEKAELAKLFKEKAKESIKNKIYLK